MQKPLGDMVFSGMQFSDFGEDNCFLIEDSRLYQKSLAHLGYKTVEFVMYKENGEPKSGKLLFVEAKTTLRSLENKTRFTDEINDISQKFIDALQIVCGVWHGARKEKPNLPANFADFRENGKKIVFLLVVKKGDRNQLLAASEAISKRLLKESRLWNFDVKVIDEQIAQQENLVLAGESE